MARKRFWQLWSKKRTLTTLIPNIVKIYMIKIQFDFTKDPPVIDIDKDKMAAGDIPLMRVAFYQMSLGEKFPKKFIFEASGKDIKIIPLIDEDFKDIKKARDVFKNLVKEAAFAYRDYS